MSAFVVAAYAVTILVLAGYAWSIRRRLAEVERRLASHPPAEATVAVEGTSGTSGTPRAPGKGKWEP
jgi:CcmD family protein